VWIFLSFLTLLLQIWQKRCCLAKVHNQIKQIKIMPKQYGRNISYMSRRLRLDPRKSKYLTFWEMPNFENIHFLENLKMQKVFRSRGSLRSNPALTRITHSCGSTTIEGIELLTLRLRAWFLVAAPFARDCHIKLIVHDFIVRFYTQYQISETQVWVMYN